MPVTEFSDLGPDEGYNPARYFKSSLSNDKDGVVLGRFVERQVVNKPDSVAAGEYIYKTVVGCYMKPAASDDVSYKEVKYDTASDLIDLFPDAWKSYINQRERPEGTTLDGVPFIDRKAKHKLFGLGIETMEQLAGMTEAKSKKVFGIPALRRQAKSYLTTAKQNKSAASKKDKTDDTENDLHGCA